MSRSSRKLLRRAGVAGLMAGLAAMPLLATAAPAAADTNVLSTTTASTADGLNTNVASGGTLHNLVDGEVVSLHIATSSSSQLNGVIDARQCDAGVNIFDSASMIPSNTGFCLDHPFPGSKGQESTGNLVKASSTDAFIDVSFRVGTGFETVTYDDGHPTLQHNGITCNASNDCTLWIEVSVNADSPSEFVHFNLDFQSTIHPVGDFDGDHQTDFGVFRPASGEWFVAGEPTVNFGAQGDVPVSADYTGDGKDDLAVFRPSSGQWWVNGVESGLFWGAQGDVPVPADYDGNRTADVAVWRPSTGQWWVKGQFVASFGANGDIPVPADYDGDGKADLAVFRPTTGQWFINGRIPFSFGANGDVPLPGDYDGDGSVDLAVFRPTTGQWFIGSNGPVSFGAQTDIPVPGDYNADGKIDIAVFRPSTGQWFTPGQIPFSFGANGDVPLPKRPAAA